MWVNVNLSFWVSLQQYTYLFNSCTKTLVIWTSLSDVSIFQVSKFLVGYISENILTTELEVS